eukprot:3755327-Rhodomonas_salina.1
MAGLGREVGARVCGALARARAGSAKRRNRADCAGREARVGPLFLPMAVAHQAVARVCCLSCPTVGHVDAAHAKTADVLAQTGWRAAVRFAGSAAP